MAQAVERVAARLCPDTVAAAQELLEIPLQVGGYGHVHEQHFARVKARWAQLFDRFAGENNGRVSAVSP